jgi:hypothetical protein
MDQPFENDKPDFSLLSGIIQRSTQVPHEQFQQELNDWFKSSLTEKYPNLESSNGEDFVDEVIKLGNKILKY